MKTIKHFFSLVVVASVFIGSCMLSGCEKDDSKGSVSNSQSGGTEPVVSNGENGALPGLFSVAPGKKVRFSQGNLQYTTVGSHACADGTT
ncbi:MAG: hypothetical protein KBT04_06840, partial [Bacteroidales bacterium]|nr:hypothetical protein [Candidatus Colimorpha onthohippi]